MTKGKVAVTRLRAGVSGLRVHRSLGIYECRWVASTIAKKYENLYVVCGSSGGCATFAVSLSGV